MRVAKVERVGHPLETRWRFQTMQLSTKRFPTMPLPTMPLPTMQRIKRVIPRRGAGGRRGQSTVEFVLMLPVLLATYFFVVQMGLYFTTIHYASYGAFTSARGLVGGFSAFYQDMTTMSQLVLNGDVWGGQAAAAGAAGATVTLTNFERRVPLPFISSMVPDMTFTSSVALGPTERDYEYVEGRGSDQYDNNSTAR